MRLSTARLLIAAVALYSSPLAAQKLTWGPAPSPFPAGAQMAVVSGDPSKAAMYTVQLKFADGYAIPPHWHATDENVVVKTGTLHVGMGDVVDKSKMKAFKAGEKGTIPAKEHHYARAGGATLVEISAMGPFSMTLVNPPAAKKP